MPATVHLQVRSSDGTSKSFSLTEHDTILLGRMADCHLCVPGDPQVSRHHFLLEACPPMTSLRDLGSMNGTHINGRKCGGREKGETPEQGALRKYPSIDLKHGDRITVGQSTIEVRVETAPDAATIPAALPQGDLSGLSPEAMRQLMVAVASRRSPCGERLAPSLLDDFTIQRELGRDGCGAVYLATPKSGGDPVAVKLMLSRAQAEPRAIEHFKREMQVIARLKHPNIVRFLDSDHKEPRHSCRAANGKRKHRAPSSTLFRPSLARRTEMSTLQADLSGMSMTGNYAGTPVFMPPEQITNFKYVKPVSDVWSFAASLYQLLTGKFPYRFDPKRDPIDIILNEHPVPIRDRMPGLAKNLAAVIDKALVRNPKERFPDAGKLQASLLKLKP